MKNKKIKIRRIQTNLCKDYSSIQAMNVFIHIRINESVYRPLQYLYIKINSVHLKVQSCRLNTQLSNDSKVYS